MSRVTSNRTARRAALIGSICAVLLTSCGGPKERAGTDDTTRPSADAVAALQGRELLVTNAGVEECFCASVADTEGERNAGLTPDGDPAPFDAMVFLWDVPTPAAFWMKDTAGPLDVAFVGTDGVVSRAVTMPSCDAEPCEVYPSPEPVRMAIEARGLERLGILPGAHVALGGGCEPE